MIRRSIIVLAAMVATSGQPLRGQTAPIGDVLMDRLVAALPDRQTAQVPPVEPEEVARLEALNPGQVDAVRAVLEENQRCRGSEIEAATLRVLRVIADRLGAAKVERLIQFYQSEDARTLRTLGDRAHGGEALSGEENAQMMRILAAHPEVVEFAQATQNSGELFMNDRIFVAGATRCAQDRRNALRQRGLRER